MNWLIKKINKKRRIIFLIILICLLISILSSYNLFDNDASYKDGKKSNTPYAVQQHVSNVNIGSSGKIESGMSAQELWDQMKKDGSRVNKYLKNPKELQRLINAQRVTDYLDTRENPDEEIDWDAINDDVDSKEVQGIVKLKRAQTDGSIATLTYVDPETFQSYIDNYNNSGSESDKQNALKHFTLEKGYKSSSSFGTGEAITAGTTITIPSGLGAYHTYMGWQMITSTSSTQYKLREQAGMNFDNEGFGRINGRYVIACTTTFGNVGDYIDFYQDDGSVLQCIIGDIKNQNDAGCNEWGHENGQVIIEFVVDKGSWYNCNHPNPGSQGFHTEWNKPLTKAINGGSYFDNPSFGSSNITANGNTTGGSSTIGNDVMKWPTDGTDITSYFGLRDAPTAGASTNHGAIDIGVPTGTNVYATEAGTVIKAEFNSSGGNWVWIDHGNGYVTKYLHNSQLKVSVGDKVTKGQVIALSGTTGTSTGPHVHFQIEYNGEKVDPLSFKYDNDMGNGTGGFGSDSSSLSTTNTFYAKVATWSEIKTTVTSNDPAVEGKNEIEYNMTTTKIDYEQFVKAYRMPFDYLWALLVITQDKNFVFDLANLVYNSEIDITVHDNLSVNTNITTDTYERQTKTITDNVRVKVEYSDTKQSYDNWDTEHENPYEVKTTGTATETGGPYEKETEVPYKTTTTIITTTNTLDVQLTRANVWIVDYSQEFKQQKQEPIVSGSETGPDTENYPEEPTRTDGNDSAGLAEGFRQEVQAKYAASHTTATATIESLTSKYYERIKDRIVKIDNTLETTTYISEPAVVKEKTDKNSKEPNFVTLLIEHKTAKGRIISGRNILFNILKKGPNTSEVMLDLTKYLLYKTTGKDYGETAFDFSIFDATQFKNVDGVEGTSLLSEFLKAWENGPMRDYMLGKVSYRSSKSIYTCVTEDKQNYIMYDDIGSGNNNRNFGYGVCFYVGKKQQFINQSYFKDEGINIEDSKYQNYGVSQLPVELVDNIKEKIIEEKREEVRKTASAKNIKLTDYQVDALAALRYQGWQIGDFLDAYKKYGLDSRIRNTTTGMGTSSDRYKANWKLFSEGIYTDQHGKEIVLASGGGILGSAYKVHKYMEENGYYYSLDTNLLKSTFEESKRTKAVCCASYVSWVLRECGAIQETNHSATGLADLLQNKYHWQRIDGINNFKAGDVLYYPYGHIEIYAGDGQVYNAGSNNAITRANPYTSNWYKQNTVYALRAPNSK